MRPIFFSAAAGLAILFGAAVGISQASGTITTKRLPSTDPPPVQYKKMFLLCKVTAAVQNGQVVGMVGGLQAQNCIAWEDIPGAKIPTT